jgi:MFS family permease
MRKNHNIGLAYLYSATAYFGITSLWVVYLGQRGLPLVLIGLCESIFHVASFCFEVPSGVLADRFGYKRVLIASRLAAAFSSVLMLLGNSFWWFAASFIISAFSYNLQSGTLEAFVYESLPLATREASYAQATARVASITEITSTLGVVLAGAMVHWHFAWTYWIIVGLALLMGFALLAAVDVGKRPREQRQTVRAIITTSLQVLRATPLLGKLMLVDAAMSAIATAYYYYFQHVMTARHFSGALVSGLMLTGAVVNVVAVQLTPFLQRRFSKSQLVRGICFVMTACLLLSYAHWLPGMLAMYLLIAGITALLYPLFNIYYNALVPSGQRATLLSVASLLFSLIMIALFPLMGWIITAIGFNLAFAGLGVVLLAGIVPTLRRLDIRE